MNNKIVKVIVESIESNRDLFFLIEKIMNMVLEKFHENLKKMRDNFVYQENMVLLYINPITLYYNDIKTSDDFSDNLKNAMKKTYPLKIYFHPITVGTIDKGNYSRIHKTINVYFELSPSDMEMYLKRDDKYAVGDFYRLVKSVLIHELKHWYDDIMTDGKTFDDLKSKRYYKEKAENRNRTPEEKIKFQERYLKLDHEISARFAQIMQDLYYTRVDSLQDVVDYFKSNFVGWNILNNRQKRSLIRKASQLYWERIKHKIKTVNIFDKLQDYASKKESEGYSIDIGTHKGNIELYSLSGRDKISVIKDLIRYSEIYRKIFIIYSDALGGINNKTIEDLGFAKSEYGDVFFDVPKDEYFRIPKRLKK